MKIIINSIPFPRLGWPKTATPGRIEGGGGMDDEMEPTGSIAEGEDTDVGTPDSWRNTTTQERDTLVGHKLQEVSKTDRGDNGRRLL